MSSSASAALPGEHPIRHTVAGWRFRSSLRARLTLFVALGAAAVIALLSLLQLRLIERTVEAQLFDSARGTAQAVADGMQLVEGTDPGGWLHDFIEATPAVRAITLVSFAGGDSSIFASTSSEERSDAIDLAREAERAGQLRAVRTPSAVLAASPVREAGRALAVVVTVSTVGADQVRHQARTMAIFFAAPTVLLLTLLVDSLARRLIHRRVAVIVSTMEQVGEGNLAARAPVDKADELGSIAAGLNEMLGRMGRFNEELQQRVEAGHRRAPRAQRGARRELPSRVVCCGTRSRAPNGWRRSARWPPTSRTRWARR